ncbi:unnamed protein product [Gordionus sp. m RMFG-2023]|uniref:kettin homolog isoform X2 n=1 Tax=Gordionus sp. m RMFG-2023 TaxID=3053472 RepID=UPI0030E18163
MKEDENSLYLPKFLSPFESLPNVIEEEYADFQSPISPADDENIKSEWFHKDKPLKIGSRYDAFLEDGVVGLCINPVYESDSGDYTCVLTNKHGSAKQSATLTCIDKSKPINRHPFRRSSIQEIDTFPVSGKNNDLISAPTKEPDLILTRPLNPNYTVNENENIILDFVIDVSIENLNANWNVEWFHNGNPLLSGDRFKPIFEYGIIGLKISKVSTCDKGRYVVKVYDKTKNGKILLKEFETFLTVNKPTDESNLILTRPLDANYTANENENIMLDLAIDVSIENLNANWDVEWFHNGTPLLSGDRYKAIFEYGIIGLKISKVSPCDNGKYCVKVYDKTENGKILLGEYETYLTVNIESNVLSDPICVNSLKQIKQLEAWENPSTRYALLHPGRPLPRPDIIKELIRRRKSAKS